MELEQYDFLTKKEKSSIRRGKWLLIISSICLIFFYFCNFYFSTVLTQESTAQFGDYIGGVLNPILGFATIALLVWSIQIQLRELRLNTKALEEQAIELKRQNDFTIRNENANSLNSEFDMYQKLFLEQQSVLNDLLDKPLGFVVGDEYITASDLIYKKNTNYQLAFSNYASDNITHLNFAKYRIAHTINQCERILEKILMRCSLPGFLNTMKTNIDWLAPFISIFYVKQLISEDRARDMYALIKQSIRNSYFQDFEKDILREQLDIHISPTLK